MFDFHEDWLVEEVKKRRAKRIALQLPEGLKPYAMRLANKIQRETGSLVILLADPCYGACDVAWEEASMLKIDLLIHFGHSKMLTNKKVDTIYVECPVKVKASEAVKAAVPLLKGHRVGLCAILQYLPSLSEALKILRDAGLEVRIAHPAKQGLKPGQVIGCDYSSGNRLVGVVDSLLFIGGGLMHPIGLRLATGLPVIAVDPWTGEVQNVEPHAKKIVAKKLLDVASSSEAKRFGVVVGLKPGQYRPGLVEKVAKELQERGRESVLIACREVSPALEVNFAEVEVFVITSCPLIALFDREAFHRPLLTPAELQLSLTGEWKSGYSNPFKGF